MKNLTGLFFVAVIALLMLVVTPCNAAPNIRLLDAAGKPIQGATIRAKSNTGGLTTYDHGNSNGLYFTALGSSPPDWLLDKADTITVTYSPYYLKLVVVALPSFPSQLNYTLSSANTPTSVRVVLFGKGSSSVLTGPISSIAGVTITGPSLGTLGYSLSDSSPTSATYISGTTTVMKDTTYTITLSDPRYNFTPATKSFKIPITDTNYVYYVHDTVSLARVVAIHAIKRKRIQSPNFLNQTFYDLSGKKYPVPKQENRFLNAKGVFVKGL